MQSIQIISVFQKITNYYKVITQSRFIKDLSITFFENIITKCLNFLSILLLTRTLGPEDYGKYSFIFVSMAFLAAFFDFGMENTAVRFSAKEKELKNNIFGLYFITKMTIMILVIATLLFFGKNIFILMKKETLIPYIPYLIIGFTGESLFFVNDTFLQAIQKFKVRAIINIIRNLAALILVILLFLNKLLILKYAFYIYFIPVLFTIGFLRNYINFIKAYSSEKINKNLLKEIFNYEKWMLLLSISTNILGRIDFLMLSFWVGYKELGIYNAAFQLTSIVSFLPFVLGKVMLPKMAELSSENVLKFTKNLAKPIWFISLIMLCLIPFVSIVVPLLLGKEYIQSVLILQILLVNCIISFATIPFGQALYSLGKPKLITIVCSIQIFINIVLNIMLIPKYGINFAAINKVITISISSVFLIYLFKRQFSNLEQV